MAFSTQKDFFHIPFLSESVEYECQPACVKLKSYESSIDYRSWSSNKKKQSKFLSDLITCQLPSEDIRDSSKRTLNTRSGNVVDPTTNRDDSSSPRNENTFRTHGRTIGESSQSGVISSSPKDKSSHKKMEHTFDGMAAGDSLLECANIHLADYQKIMNVKSSLEKQLTVSNERLNMAKEENNKIKEILNSKLDSNTNKDFYNKIQKLIAAGKLTKTEENELLQIHKKIENILVANDTVKAENNYVKRLIEKLSARVTIDQIQTENETSIDVKYLQNTINKLRKECLLLRNIEEDYHRIKQGQPNYDIADQDVKNIKMIIEERNRLREKCNSLKDVKKNLDVLKNKNQKLDAINEEIRSNLTEQSSYIKTMECEMQDMERCYQEQLQIACNREQSLRNKLEDLNDEIIHLKCQSQKFEMLQKENACLRNEISKRDREIYEYDCQYRQLMDVVEELQSLKLQCLQDKNTQTFKNEMDDLAYFTCATLEEITKELKKRGCTNSLGNLENYDNNMTAGSRDPEVCKTCCEALQRLQELEDEKERLRNENIQMKEIIKDGEDKMTQMLNKIEHMDRELIKNADELRRSSNEMAETKKLVEDISNIHIKNQQLSNAVDAINSRDDEKIIDDLRRQLEDEMTKLKKSQQENISLTKQAAEKENELKSLKELNNKLQKDISILQLDHKSKGTELFAKGNKNENDHDHIDHQNITNDTKAIFKNEDYSKNKNNTNLEFIQKDLNTITNKTLIKYKQISEEEDTFSINEVPQNPQNSLIDIPTASENISLDPNTQGCHEKPKPFPTIISKRRDRTTFDAFVVKSSEKLRSNFTTTGVGFETDVAKILMEFMREYNMCSNRSCCCSRSINSKSKFLSICHKLYHNGIKSLAFAELAYMHRKIYKQAEEIQPGCLLNMTVQERKEEILGILNINLNATLPYSTKSEIDVKPVEILQKCCSCKQELCCTKSEEMLKDKVIELSKEIETTRELLDTMKEAFNGSQEELIDSSEVDNSTYRAISPIQKVSTKQLKKVKPRLLKNANVYRG
ncbi:uncharacterized protein LOC142220421 isoform X1 [Haematobia irritans]|uniref:uncharacterized protein LOC142220421 isoform X1 n=1 Tax=Haematobia irritans TaxID=7368 RepID=UPI003F4FB4C0